MNQRDRGRDRRERRKLKHQQQRAAQRKLGLDPGQVSLETVELTQRFVDLYPLDGQDADAEEAELQQSMHERLGRR
jgi:hypothetical protein